MARTPNPWGDPVRVRRKGDVFKIVYYPTGLVGDPATRKTYPGSWNTPEEPRKRRRSCATTSRSTGLATPAVARQS